MPEWKKPRVEAVKATGRGSLPVSQSGGVGGAHVLPGAGLGVVAWQYTRIRCMVHKGRVQALRGWTCRRTPGVHKRSGTLRL